MTKPPKAKDERLNLKQGEIATPGHLGRGGFPKLPIKRGKRLARGKRSLERLSKLELWKPVGKVSWPDE